MTPADLHRETVEQRVIQRLTELGLLPWDDFSALLGALNAAEKKIENQRRTLVEFECAISARNAQIWAMKQRALDPDKMTAYMNAAADYPLRDPAPALPPEEKGATTPPR